MLSRSPLDAAWIDVATVGAFRTIAQLAPSVMDAEAWAVKPSDQRTVMVADNAAVVPGTDSVYVPGTAPPMARAGRLVAGSRWPEGLPDSWCSTTFAG